MARPLWLELASALYQATSHHTAMGERTFTSALNHTITTIADYFNVNYATISNGLKGMKTRFRYVVMQDLTLYRNDENAPLATSKACLLAYCIQYIIKLLRDFQIIFQKILRNEILV